MHKNLWSIAAILVALGYLLQSISTSFAYSGTPSVSLGNNPVFARSATGYNNVTVFTNNGSSVAIITDLTSLKSSNYSCTMHFYVTNSDDSYRLSSWASSNDSSVSLRSGLQVPAGESLMMNGNSYCTGGAVSGYYAH